VPANYLYLGVEVETEAEDSDDRNDAAQKIDAAHADFILMKEDGSLNCGIELVSGKYGLDAHGQLWPKLCETATKAGLRSWKHKSTGMHVHLSRAFFTQLGLGKLIVFINSDNPDVRRHIRSLAGRDSSHYAQIEKKKLACGCLRSANRYEAVNLCNAKTVEIRIFKGTLKSDHILANLQFCHAVASWTAQCSIQDCENWDSFFAYVLNHRKSYKQLVAFFTTQSREDE
jgi:hypothetical protein